MNTEGHLNALNLGKFFEQNGTLIKQTAIALSARVSGVIIAFLTQIVLARLMGVEGYGFYIIALTWISVLALPGVLGADITILRYVSEYRERNKPELIMGILRWGQSQTLLLCTLIAVVAGGSILIMPMAAQEKQLYWLAFLLLPIWMIFRIRCLAVQALREVIQALNFESIYRPVLHLILIGLSYYLFGLAISPGVAMATNLIATSVLLIILGGFLNKLCIRYGGIKSNRASEVSQWRGVAIGLFWVSCFYQILASIDILLVGYLIDSNEAGIYATALRTASIIGYLMIAANAIAAPIFAECNARQDITRLEVVARSFSKGITAIAVPLALMLLFFGNYILGWFGPEFLRGSYTLKLLVFSELTNVVVGSVGFILSMTGHQNRLARILFFGTACNILLTVLFIKLWGMEGAAISKLVTNLVINLLLVIATIKTLRINPTIIGAQLKRGAESRL